MITPYSKLQRSGMIIESQPPKFSSSFPAARQKLAICLGVDIAPPEKTNLTCCRFSINMTLRWSLEVADGLQQTGNNSGCLSGRSQKERCARADSLSKRAAPYGLKS